MTVALDFLAAVKVIAAAYVALSVVFASASILFRAIGQAS